MKNKELKKYLDSIEFKLKDYNTTYNKYKNYKNDKFKSINESWMRFIGDYFDLFDDYSKLTPWFVNRLENIGENKTKKNIRELKTLVNHRMREAINNWLDNFDLNSNELKCFTIRFYLEHYKDINKTMKVILKDYILIK